MRIAVGDLEANGLLDQATVIHCGVFKDISTSEVVKFLPNQMKEMCDYLDSVDVLIMHNGIGYDLPLMEKLLGYSYKGKKVDSLIMSRLHQPNRLRPFNMPKGVKGGPHSLAAWGYRVGRGKPDHEDWESFSDEMLHRCTEDVEITHLTYNALLKEQRELGGRWREAYLMTFNLFEILQKQEAFGWLVDRPHLIKSIKMLNHWMDRIDRAVYDRLPMVVEVLETKKSGEYNYVRKPFLVSGKLNDRVVEYFGDESGKVCGPHSRVHFRRVSLDKDAEVKTFLLNLGWEPLEWNKSDKTGEITSPKLSKDDPFDGVQGSLGRLIARRVQCKSRRGIMEGWLSRIRPDGRLPSVVTGLAATGRAKHSEIVNVPNTDSFFGKWMRKTFTCPPDRSLIGCDAKGCQDRMLAERAKSNVLTDMLLNGDKDKGTDGHSVAMKAVNIALRREGKEEIRRGKAKNYNFAIKFGASDAKLGKMAGSTEKLGAAIRGEYAKTPFKGQLEVVEKLVEEWRRNAKTKKGKWGNVRYYDGWISGLDGRPIYIGSEHAVLVYCLQSDEAIMMSAAYVMLYKRLLAKGFKWGRDWAYVCWYHDEYTIECKKELVPVIKGMAEQAIADAGKLFGLNYCPQIGEAANGSNWYDIH